MDLQSDGSVTHSLGALKAGGAAAAQRLWERYFDGLIRVARANLGAMPRSAADEEGVALSDFHTFCQGAARGRFPRLDHRDNLWRLLVTITASKTLDQVRRRARKKRGGGRVPVGSAQVGGDDDGIGAGLEQVVGREPAPEFAAMVAVECRRQLAALDDETLRQVALLRTEGYSDEEIAARVDCSLRTVSRKLALIRKAWLCEGAS
jgi:DNA-directed RNA polymerase specialized sigma24 family protein